MQSFKRYLKESLTISADDGCFIKLTPTARTIKNIVEFFGEVLEQKDLHCTLIFTENKLDSKTLPTISKSSDKVYIAAPDKLEVFGGKDLVLTLKDCPEIYSLQEKLVKALTGSESGGIDAYQKSLGFKFPEYRPHMTIRSTPVSEAVVKQLNLNLSFLERTPLEFYFDGINPNA
jgi:hypothetical protein